MIINGTNGGSSQATAASGAAPADALSQLLLVLRRAQQAHRETEEAFSNAAIDAAEARARHAADKAEATRNHAILQLCITAGKSLTALCGDIGAMCSGDDRAGSIADTVNGAASGLGELGVTTDEAFGFGRATAKADAQMERDATQQTRLQTYADRARLDREATDEALSDVRGALRDIANRDDGGQS